jgi:hypothetical protein
VFANIDTRTRPSALQKQKGTLEFQSALRKFQPGYFFGGAPRIASFAALATRNFTTRLAGI